MASPLARYSTALDFVTLSFMQRDLCSYSCFVIDLEGDYA